MLKKKNRVSKKEVEEVFKKGSFLVSKSFALRFLYTKNTQDEPKVSFVASKANEKSAVKRNSLKRLGFSALKANLHQFPLGFLGVFVFSKGFINYLRLEKPPKKSLIEMLRKEFSIILNKI